MNYRKIESLDHLIKSIKDGHTEYFIALAGNCRSSKIVTFNEEAEVFDILNEIDDTFDTLTKEQMMDQNLTNIGDAIKKGAFYRYEWS